MKHRNPLFVAGFPYGLFLISYFVLSVLGQSVGEDGQLPESAQFPLIGSFLLAMIGSGYYIYWSVVTARALRQETGESIPPAILIIIPLANYWWMWRYSVAVEKFTNGKIQTALGFLVLFMVGPIGAGIIQDAFNKKIDS